MNTTASNAPQHSVIDSLNDAPVSFFHLRAAFTAGMGFFTDAYDLFIIGRLGLGLHQTGMAPGQ